MAKHATRSNHWKFSEARAKLSEVIRKARTEGPQFVMRRDGNSVVFLSVEEHEKLAGKLPPASNRKARP
jgi:antitoxin Phd